MRKRTQKNNGQKTGTSLTSKEELQVANGHMQRCSYQLLEPPIYFTAIVTGWVISPLLGRYARETCANFHQRHVEGGHSGIIGDNPQMETLRRSMSSSTDNQVWQIRIMDSYTAIKMNDYCHMWLHR